MRTKSRLKRPRLSTSPQFYRGLPAVDVEGVEEEGMDVNFSKVRATCIYCNRGGEVLVCCRSECPVGFHSECLDGDPKFDELGSFYCPYCWYKRELNKSLELKKKAKLARKALAVFVNFEAVSDEKQNDGKDEEEQSGAKSKGEHLNQKNVVDDGETRFVVVGKICQNEEDVARVGLGDHNESRVEVVGKVGPLPPDGVSNEVSDSQEEKSEGEHLNQKNVVEERDTRFVVVGKNFRNDEDDVRVGIGDHNESRVEVEGEVDTLPPDHVSSEVTDSEEEKRNDVISADDLLSKGKMDGENSDGQIDNAQDERIVEDDEPTGTLNNHESIQATSDVARPSEDNQGEQEEEHQDLSDIGENAPENGHENLSDFHSEPIALRQKRFKQASKKATQNKSTNSPKKSSLHSHISKERARNQKEKSSPPKESRESQESPRSADSPQKSSSPHLHISNKTARPRIQKEKSTPSKRSSQFQGSPKQSPKQFINLIFANEKRKRLHWRLEEEEMLREGVQRFSSTVNKNIPWRKILQFGHHIFDATRTPSDLKDKWRNIMAKM